MEIKELDLHERRALISAVKELSKFRLDAIATDYGIFTNNLHGFLSGRGGHISVKSQFLVLRNYGFRSDGKLADYLHTWSLSNENSFELLEVCLSFESHISKIIISDIEVTVPIREFVGVLLEIKTNDGLKPRRITLANNDISLGRSEFSERLELSLRKLAPDTEVEFNKLALEISRAEAIETVRWLYSRISGRKTPYRAPPKVAHVSYDYELRARSESADDAMALLERMLPRFERLSSDVSKLRGTKQSSWDISLINRVKKFLGVQDV